MWTVAQKILWFKFPDFLFLFVCLFHNYVSQLRIYDVEYIRYEYVSTIKTWGITDTAVGWKPWLLCWSFFCFVLFVCVFFCFCFRSFTHAFCSKVEMASLVKCNSWKIFTRDWGNWGRFIQTCLSTSLF